MYCTGMSSVELKSIRVRDGCARQSGSGDGGADEVKLDVDSCENMRKVVTYKLFDNVLRDYVENKLKDNEDMLFCGFEVDTEYDCVYKNAHFKYSMELSYLKNSFMENEGMYLRTVANNRFWFSYLLNRSWDDDIIQIYVPAGKGFTVPKVRAKFVKFETWKTGCFFKKTRYAVVSEDC